MTGYSRLLILSGLAVLVFAPCLTQQLHGADGTKSSNASLVTPKMSFLEASKPYEAQKYTFEGHVGSDGKVKKGGLGCSGYASAVLHRMRDGESWLKTYSLKVHTEYGDKIAEHFGLKESGKFPADDVLDPMKVKTHIAAGRLTAGTLYLFNVRKEENGHVGFVRLDQAGNINQWHYSGIKDFEGLASGDFRIWLKASMYRKADVQLFAIPEEAKAK